MNTDTLIAILGMAGVTWACRAGGLMLATRLPREGRVAQGLRALPGCVLAALVVPAIAAGGPAEWIAAAATALAVALTRSVPLAMFVGVAAAALARGAFA